MKMHLSNGETVSLGEFNARQADVIKKSSLVSGSYKIGDSVNANRAVIFLVTIFAEHIRDLCERYGVPVDICESVMIQIQEEIRNDVDILKWAESSREKYDVGFDGIANLIKHNLTTVEREEHVIGYRLTLTFPYVDIGDGKSGKDATRDFFFSLENISHSVS
ncbi:MAG: hypothetical protein KAS32_26880 [Candidatus Peribacteraceae bacterium]|nr:hypothetical protein [Candidatus Peribacteraceae bacterium]